ncbi:hypothetical protein [Streptomyces sp. NPDC002537]
MFLAVLLTVLVLATVTILMTGASPAMTFSAAALLAAGLITAWTKLRRALSSDPSPKDFRANFNYSNRIKGVNFSFQVGAPRPSPDEEGAEEGH